MGEWAGERCLNPPQDVALYQFEYRSPLNALFAQRGLTKEEPFVPSRGERFPGDEGL